MLTEDQVDGRAAAVAGQFAAGAVGERQARGVLAALVDASRVPGQVAAGVRGLHTQQRVDLTDAIRMVLVDYALDSQSQFLDVSRFVTASMSGWMRMVAWKVARFNGVVVPVRKVDAATVVTSMQVADDGRCDPLTVLAHAASAAEDDLADGGERVLDLASIAAGVAAKDARSNAKVFAGASVLRTMMGLPMLCLPAPAADREFVAGVCRADERAAGASVRAALDALTGVGAIGEGVDERLLGLWDDFPLAKLVALADAGPQAAHVLVMGSVVLLPKPGGEVVAAASRRVREALVAGSASSPGGRLVRHLVGSVVARNCEAVSEYNGSSSQVQVQAAHEAAVKVGGQLQELAAEVIDRFGPGLGADAVDLEHQVLEVLVDEMDAGVADRLERRILAA